MAATDSAPALSPEQADATIRSKRYVGLLIVVAVIGVVVSLAAWCFLEGIYQIQQEFYVHLPHAVGYQNGPPKWWPLPVLALGATICALAILRLPGNGGHIPAEGLAMSGGPAVAATALARPTIAQNGSATRVRFVPQANLANPDPVWTTATVAINHGYMVWDTLYGINDALAGQPQMVAGHETSADELTWTFTVRDGLKFHDNEPVRALDCTTSIARWQVKDPFGQTLAARTEEMKPLDDKRFQIRLKQRFRQMTYALGAANCFVMPERMAKTPASEQIKEYVGSGPYVFRRDEWVSGASVAYEKFAGYVPRQEKPEYCWAARLRISTGSNGLCSPTPRRPPPRCKPAKSIGWSSPCSTCCPPCARRPVARWIASILWECWRSLRSTIFIRRSTTRRCCARCCRRSTRRNT